MHKFWDKLKVFIWRHKLINSQDRLLIGFSGGADSTALLHSCHQLQKELGIDLSAAHVNYHLRGDDSHADQRYVTEFCHDRHIPLYTKEVNLAGSKDLENKARKIRLQFFNELCRAGKFNKIALGHNKEDVAETMLLHLFRGSGITGMRGILPKNGNIIRPLICFSRIEIINYLKGAGINEWCVDKSNLDPIYTRNKLRLELLPYIRREINPNVIEILYSNSRIYQYTEDFLQEHSSQVWEQVLNKTTSNSISLNLSLLKKQNPIIVFYILRKSLSRLTGSGLFLTQTNFEDIYRLFETEGCKEIMLANNLCAIKTYNELLLLKNDNKNGKRKSNDLTAAISLSQDTVYFDNQLLTLRRVSASELDKSCYRDNNKAAIDADKLALPLEVSYRRDGDGFIPLGMRGRKKVKDYFIDKKISVIERDKVPIVRDRNKIVWLAGHIIDNRVKITNETKNVLLIELERNYRARLSTTNNTTNQRGNNGA